VIDQDGLLPNHAFVVILVVTEQVLIAEFLARGIVDDAEKVGKNGLADFLGERLTFVHVFLAMAFGAVPKNFVEEHGGGATGQERRTNGWIVERRDNEAFHFFADLSGSRKDGFVVGRIGRIDPIEILITVDVHAIAGFALNKKLEAVANLAILELGAFGSELDGVFRKSRERDN